MPQIGFHKEAQCLKELSRFDELKLSPLKV